MDAIRKLEFDRRTARFLQAAALDEVLLFSHAQALGASTQSFPNLSYLLGIETGSATCLVRLSRHRPPVLTSTSYFLIADLERLHPDVVCVYSPQSTFGDTVVDQLSGWDDIGLVGGDEMPRALWLGLTSRINADRLAPLDDLLARQRLAPDETQRADQEKAGTLVDALFDLLPGQPLRTEPLWMTQRRLEAAALLLGADHCTTWATVGPCPDFCHSAKGLAWGTPQDGDQFLLGVMLTVQGTWGHAIRTFHLGRPSSLATRLNAEIVSIQDEIVRYLQPGVDLSVIDAQVETLYSDRFEGQLSAARRFRTLHGLGFSYEEPLASPIFRHPFDKPSGRAPETVRAASGMVFEVHPNVFLPGAGAAAVGDMVLLTDAGPLRLTQYPRGINPL